MKKTYHKREWLTKVGDPATPAVVSFAGKTKWGGEDNPSEFFMLEISSCHDKVRLHKTSDQTKEDWIKQMEKLHSHIGSYLEFLKSQSR